MPCPRIGERCTRTSSSRGVRPGHSSEWLQLEAARGRWIDPTGSSLAGPEASRWIGIKGPWRLRATTRVAGTGRDGSSHPRRTSSSWTTDNTQRDYGELPISSRCDGTLHRSRRAPCVPTLWKAEKTAFPPPPIRNDLTSMPRRGASAPPRPLPGRRAGPLPGREATRSARRRRETLDRIRSGDPLDH